MGGADKRAVHLLKLVWEHTSIRPLPQLWRAMIRCAPDQKVRGRVFQAHGVRAPDRGGWEPGSQLQDIL